MTEADQQARAEFTVILSVAIDPKGWVRPCFEGRYWAQRPGWLMREVSGSSV
jgi:hypothetical protein